MTQSSQRFPWGCLSIFAAIVIAVVLLVTNPSHASHSQRLRTELDAAMTQQIQQDGFFGGTLLWMVKADTLEAVMQRVDYQNYLVCSTTTIDGEQTTFGICGQVMVSKDRQQ